MKTAKEWQHESLGQCDPTIYGHCISIDLVQAIQKDALGAAIAICRPHEQNECGSDYVGSCIRDIEELKGEL
jgi:hypothetical protein